MYFIHPFKQLNYFRELTYSSLDASKYFCVILPERDRDWSRKETNYKSFFYFLNICPNSTTNVLIKKTSNTSSFLRVNLHREKTTILFVVCVFMLSGVWQKLNDENLSSRWCTACGYWLKSALSDNYKLFWKT